MGVLPLAFWDFGFEIRGRHGCLSLASVVCCEIEVSVLSRRSLTERGVSECDREASAMKRPWLTGAVVSWRGFV
jgi:hypothetical protein